MYKAEAVGVSSSEIKEQKRGQRTYSTFLAQSGGLLRVINAQLVRMVNMINTLNIVHGRQVKEALRMIITQSR